MHLRVLTNSEAGTFACPRRWGFKYLDGLTTKTSSAPLRQGSLSHDCIGAHMSSQFTMCANELHDVVIVPWLERSQEWVMENLRGNRRDERIYEDEQLAALTAGMMEGYVNEYRDDGDVWEVLHVEMQVARFIPGPGTKGILTDAPLMANGKRMKRYWVQGGAVDALCRNKETGQVWQWEHKNTDKKDLVKFCDKLDWDPQNPTYNWCLRNPHPAATMKEPVRPIGVVYNVLRKKLPSIPLLKKDGTTSKAKACDTTPAVFKQTLLERGENPDDFIDLMKKLEGNIYFHRKFHPILDAEIERYEEELRHRAEAIKHASRHDTHLMRQFSVCTGWQGIDCEFKDVCIDYDGDWQGHGFRKKNIRHEELVGELAESCAQERGLTMGSHAEKGPNDFVDDEEAVLALAEHFTYVVSDAEDEDFDFDAI